MKNLTLEQYVVDIKKKVKKNRHPFFNYFDHGVLSFNVFDRSTLTLLISYLQCEASFNLFARFFEEGYHRPPRVYLAPVEVFPDDDDYCSNFSYIKLRKDLLLKLFRLTSFLGYLIGWKQKGAPVPGNIYLYPSQSDIEKAVDLSKQYASLIEEKDAAIICDFMFETMFVVNNIINSTIANNSKALLGFVDEEVLINQSLFKTDQWKEHN